MFFFFFWLKVVPRSKPSNYRKMSKSMTIIWLRYFINFIVYINILTSQQKLKTNKQTKTNNKNKNKKEKKTKQNKTTTTTTTTTTKNLRKTSTLDPGEKNSRIVIKSGTNEPDLVLI